MSFKLSPISNRHRAGFLLVVYCKTEDQMAEVLTKALSKDKFAYCVGMIVVKSATSLEGSVKI